MGIILKQGLRNSIIQYAGVVLGFILTIWLFPKTITPDQFGLTRVMLAIASLTSMVGDLGIRHTTIKYFPYFHNEEKGHHGILAWIFLIPLLGISIICGLFYLFQESIIAYYDSQSDLFGQYYNYLFVLLFTFLYFELLITYLQAQLDTVKASFLQHVLVRFFVIIALTAHYFGMITFHQFVIAFIASYAIQPFLIIGYLVASGKFSIKPDLEFLNLNFVKEMLIYGGYNMIGGLTTLVVGKVDIIMLGAMTTLDNSGIYAVAFYVGSVILVPRQGITKIALPVIAQAFKRNDLKQIRKIYQKTAHNQLMVGLLLYIGIWANMHNLMDILPKAYQSGTYVILIIGAARLFDMSTGINGGIIKNSEFYRFSVIANVILVVATLITNYIFIPMFGVMGAAIATGFSIMFYNAIKVWYVWLKLKMQPFHLKSFWIVLVGAGVLLLAWQVDPIYNLYVDIIARSTGMALIFLALSYLFHLSDDFNQLADRVLGRFFGKNGH